MDRRVFLKAMSVTAGMLGSGYALAACGDGGASAPAAEIPTGPSSLNVINASFETLTGTDRRFAFGISTRENVPVKGSDAQVWLRDLEGNVQSGPYAASFYDEGGPVLGIYVTRLDLPEAGPAEIVVVTEEGHGTAVINVVRPEDSPIPVPGGDAIAAATPTTADDQGVEALCTRQPPCGMHEVNLEDALASGAPTVLIFATPAFCQTAVCAPAVSTLEEIRTAEDWGDTQFIHVEIFSDAGQTVTPAVQQWGLRSEPWLYTIDGTGKVVDRLDGPMVRAELTEMISVLS